MSIQSTLDDPLTSEPLVIKTAAELIVHPQLEIVVLHAAADASRTPAASSIADAIAASAANRKARERGWRGLLTRECRITGFLLPEIDGINMS
jgi:hypothetical protein